MTADPDTIDLSTFMAEHLERAEADAICGAPYGARSDERTNSHNSYRTREWVQDGEVPALVFPELVEGSYELFDKGSNEVRLVLDVRGGDVTTARWPA